MKNTIQVFQYRGYGSARAIVEIWEFGYGAMPALLMSSILETFLRCKDDTFKVSLFTDDFEKEQHFLIWGLPPRCRKQRLCVFDVKHETTKDFETYCRNFLFPLSTLEQS